jgi:hypothetical protein
MEQSDYEKVISGLVNALPKEIEGDHRVSLKSRLKYGNEHSLRKRLTDMLGRIPENVRLKIAGDVSKFVTKVVDTRNYYTHYDHASEENALHGKEVYIVAERLRILIVVSLLHDLGIDDDQLLNILERKQEFAHWMAERLSL